MRPDQANMFLILGGVFIVFSLIMFRWARSEKQAYRNRLMQKPDLREFLTNWPPRWWVSVLNVGGFIGIPTGIVLIIIGLVFRS